MYALRNKGTGELQFMPRVNAFVVLIASIAYAYPGGCYPDYLELITFRAEPVEYCKGCIHDGEYEREIEVGAPSPCTYCRRRCPDNYTQTRTSAGG